ncbi:hypothetical protein [Halobacillus halophilus]|uniref:hypothetical protein n=1 Tax=Halobacillus halophilus TaxID=1570 RepID=UPI001CD7281E|nr:hypothetical protein [Halobacillus halophilus]MCA1011269.1 hypothetical protein [Halobacillus halophilus]
MVRRSISIAFVLWVFSFLFLYNSLNSVTDPVWILIFLVPPILFLVMSEKTTFLLFIAFTVISSLIILGMAFVLKWNSYTQLEWVMLHALVLVNLWSVYVLAKWSSSLSRDNKQLQNRVIELEEYIADTKLLSKREFEKQKEIIVTSMDRKKEKGFLLYIGIEKLPRRVKQTSFVKVSNVIYESVRKHFDIVGKYDDQVIVCLLQNTDEDGLAIVKNRIISRLKIIYTPEAFDKLQWNTEGIGYIDFPASKEGPQI